MAKKATAVEVKVEETKAVKAAETKVEETKTAAKKDTSLSDSAKNDKISAPTIAVITPKITAQNCSLITFLNIKKTPPL